MVVNSLSAAVAAIIKVCAHAKTYARSSTFILILRGFVYRLCGSNLFLEVLSNFDHDLVWQNDYRIFIFGKVSFFPEENTIAIVMNINFYRLNFVALPSETFNDEMVISQAYKIIIIIVWNFQKHRKNVIEIYRPIVLFSMKKKIQIQKSIRINMF